MVEKSDQILRVTDRHCDHLHGRKPERNVYQFMLCLQMIDYFDKKSRRTDF